MSIRNVWGLSYILPCMCLLLKYRTKAPFSTAISSEMTFCWIPNGGSKGIARVLAKHDHEHRSDRIVCIYDCLVHFAVHIVKYNRLTASWARRNLCKSRCIVNLAQGNFCQKYYSTFSVSGRLVWCRWRINTLSEVSARIGKPDFERCFDNRAGTTKWGCAQHSMAIIPKSAAAICSMKTEALVAICI